MRHLIDQELVALMFGELPPGTAAKDAVVWKSHLTSCSECRTKLEDLRGAVELLQRSRLESPPPFGWARLQARIERQAVSRGGRDEPSWLRVAFGNLGGIFLAVALIAIVGSALESAAVWKLIAPWPICRQVGARGLVALVFFGSGSLLALALAPVLWWESKRSRRG